jgi:hypothetical protein
MPAPSSRRSRRSEERSRSREESRKARARGRHGVLDEDDDDDEDEDYDNSATIQALEARYGSAKAALAQVHRERFQESKKRRKLRAILDETEEELEELREQLGITEGVDLPEKPAIVSEADKAELEKYRKLGKLDEVTKKVEDFEKLSAKAADADALALRTEAAKLAGGWDPDILADLVKAMDLVVEIKEVEGEGGKKTRVPFVRANKDGAESSRLTDFVEKDEKAKKYKPALTANGGGTGDEPPPASFGAMRGVPYPRTSGGSGEPPKHDVVQKTVGVRDVRPSARRAGATSDK